VVDLPSLNSGRIWREKLADWAIPQEIVDQAPENPWIHPVELFQIPKVILDNPSHLKARQAMPQAGSVLDIGCGGGIAAFALTPPASLVIGIDHQPDMLEIFENNANDRNLESLTFEGFWPQIEGNVPKADVVTAHHVVYNVPNIEDFILEASNHAHNRVVIEMPDRHPQSNAAALWKHFWNLDRPASPSSDELMDVIYDLGIVANREKWQGQMRREQSLEQLARYSRIRLCLPESREDEVLEFLRSQPRVDFQDLVTIWWDIL